MDLPGSADSRNQDKRSAERIPANFSVSFREIADDEAERLNELKGGLNDLPVSVPESTGVTAPSGESAAGHSENISQGGLSLTGDLELLGDRKLDRGKKLLVEFALPGEPAPVSAVAVVVWAIEGKGIHGKFTAGLMFTGIDSRDLDKIQRFCRGG